MTVWALVVAAGAGDRFGGPKQYEWLGDRRVLDWSVASARHVCDGVVLVVPPGRAGEPEPSVDAVVEGGATRSASVRAGLSSVPGDASVIIVHDAARPLASPRLWRRVLDALSAGADAAIPVVPVTDTLREAGRGTVDRSRFEAVQTPQAFRAAVLHRAHEGQPQSTDDASLVEVTGGKVVTVAGEPENRKITSRSDLASMAVLLG